MFTICLALNLLGTSDGELLAQADASNVMIVKQKLTDVMAVQM